MADRPGEEGFQQMTSATVPGTDSGARERRSGGSGMGEGMGMGRGEAVALDLHNLRTFESLKNPVFRLYFGAMWGWFGSMNVRQIARSLLIYRIGRTATVLGVMSLANSLPMLLFSLFGGVLADRVQKKHVLFVGVIASGILSLAIALTISLGYLGPQNPGSWWILVVAGAFEATIMGLMMPSRQAMIVEIVGQEQLMNAVALNTLEMNFNRLFMPALAGYFIAGFGFEAAFYTITGLCVLSALFVFIMPATGTISLRGRGAWGDLGDGFRYVRRQPIILLILVVSFFIVLCSTPYMSLLPIFTDDILKVGAGGMGTLISVSGIGAIAGSLVLASLPNKRRGAIMMWGSLFLGLALTGFSFSASWPLSLGMIVLVGLGQTFRMTLGNTLLQYYVEDEYRGRVMALYMMEFGLTSFGAFFAAVMADGIGVQWSVGGLAMVLVAICVLVLAFVPAMRKLD